MDITVERLERLCQFIEHNVDEKHFNMVTWFDGIEGHWNEDFTSADLLHACNTSACALGFACLIPEFRADGLKPEYNSGFLKPTYRNGGSRQTGTSAAMSFFQLSYPEAYELFNNHPLDTPSMWVARARAFIETLKAVA